VTGGKIVKLQRPATWRDLDLHWEEEDDEEESGEDNNSTVVAFRKDEKE
jgi:hypothetical protein